MRSQSAKSEQCDEQKPNCANCVKQGTSCEYRTSKGSREPSFGSPVADVTASATPSSQNGHVIDQAIPSATISASDINDVPLNISQMRLIHHYMTVTAKSLAYGPEAEEVLSSLMLQLAFKHTYLLYSILALTSLHLSRLGDPEVPPHYWLQQSEAYHNAALSAFQTDVRDLDSHNFKAILFFAGTLFPYACVASMSASNDVEYAFDNILSHLVLTRRIRPMVASHYQQMKESELRHIIPPDVQDINWETEEAPVETELIQLRKFSEVVHHIFPPDIVDAYGYAIHVLELIFHIAAKSPLPPSDALLKIWIHFVSDRYMELLSDRQPGSLIIFAHYAVMLHRAEYHWYLEGLAEQVLRIAEQMVPKEWESWLDWPKEQIRNRSSIHTPGSVTWSLVDNPGLMSIE